MMKGNSPNGSERKAILKMAPFNRKVNTPEQWRVGRVKQRKRTLPTPTPPGAVPAQMVQQWRVIVTNVFLARFGRHDDDITDLESSAWKMTV